MELTSISSLELSLQKTSHTEQLNKIRFLTLNLYLRPPPIHENKSDFKELRTDYFIEHILPNYDIICLQEVFDLFNSRKERIINAALNLGFTSWATSPIPSFLSTFSIDGGLLILSRFPIVETDWGDYRIGAFPDSMCDKGVLYCKLDVLGTNIHILTTHTQSSYPTIQLHDFQFYREVRRQQFRTARSLIDNKYVPGELMVLLGDLNVDAREDRQPSPFGVDYM